MPLATSARLLGEAFLVSALGRLLSDAARRTLIPLLALRCSVQLLNAEFTGSLSNGLARLEAIQASPLEACGCFTILRDVLAPLLSFLPDLENPARRSWKKPA